MWELLTEAGRMISADPFDWQMHQKEWLLTTTGATKYALPDDFEYFINSTGWNRTGRLPLIGPLANQEWQLLQARQLGGTTIRLQYQIVGDQLELYAAPSTAQQLAFSYHGRGWVRDATAPTTFRDNVVNDGDTVLFPPTLMVAALKLKWREAKRFDTGTEQKDYDMALEYAKSNDTPSQDVYLGARPSFPYLGYMNMTDTGYGQ